ncbi:MAG: ABC transporter ATP-binding protein [Lentisphaeria bacterium]
MPSSLATYKRLLGYTRPYRKRLIIGIVAGIIAGGSLFGILRFIGPAIQPFTGQVQTVSDDSPAPEEADDTAPPLTGTFVDNASEKMGIEPVDENGVITWQFMVVIVTVLSLFAILKAVMTFLNKYCMRWVGARVVVDLRARLFEHLQNQSLKFFGKCDVGNLISRCVHDTNTVESAVSKTVADLTRAPIEILAALSFIIYKSFGDDLLGVMGVLVLVVPLIMLPLVVLGRRIKSYTRQALQGISHLVSRMQENFTGIRVVKAFHTERSELERFEAMNSGYFSAIIGAVRAELFIQPLMEAVGIACVCFALVFCKVRGVSLADIMPMAIAVYYAYRPLKQVIKINTGIQRSSAAAERLFEILDADTALPEASKPVELKEFKDQIKFENVSFSYDEDGEEILSDISFELPCGHVAAFVGETGSGKTTVANLLARFYDPTKGRVTLDDIDLRDAGISSIRRLVGVVTQETVLFNTTIAENIAYGTPEATREDVIEAARKANAHEFIVANPDGYERVVGEKGFVLSGGQRQRVAIARAILRNPPILILDEATSALDTVTERLVQEALFRLMENRTVFAIAHRLSTIKHADQIYLLDQGTIVEHGTHQELYDHEGLYRHLCDIQFS